MTAPADKEKPSEQTGPKPGKKPEGIYRFAFEGQPPRAIALVSGSTTWRLKTLLPAFLYRLRGVDPQNIRLYTEQREIPDDEVITKTIPDDQVIRVEVRR